jgi:hypothetical protein
MKRELPMEEKYRCPVSSKLSLFDLQLSLVNFFELGLSILSKSSNSLQSKKTILCLWKR